MKQLKLIACLLSLVWLAGCSNDEKCQRGILPFFNGEGKVVEELKCVDCFYEMNYYCEATDTEYLFFCYADDAEQWFSDPNLAGDFNNWEDKVARKEYLRNLIDKDGTLSLSEIATKYEELFTHYAKHSFAITKDEYLKITPFAQPDIQLEQGTKMRFEVDLTDLTGYYDYNYCGGITPLDIGYNLWSPHFDNYIQHNIRRGYLKANCIAFLDSE